ncbi:unnamed protein product [Bursaphelenchus okinawaensis]|uniref:Tyrosine-protein kinase n=1 Tax=Bursaphelenchus okinawaensis TaxID=465554 RepID=A0A811LQG3_9BILA|nr:unnamed protein product [Bursaphelenchus okinawaensis]CAG9125780.1 unnamed protein product [Bursaphelenchus okinawaensis]
MNFDQNQFFNLTFIGRPPVQPRFPIQMPLGAYYGYDPYENPNEILLPIDDSFRQTVHPVDDKGHIIFQAPQQQQGPAETLQHNVVDDGGTTAPTRNVLDPNEDFDPYGGNEPIQLEEKVKNISLKETGINELEYHHGLLPREDINLMLKEPGDFLLRCTSTSSQGQRQTCLSVMGNNGYVEHFMIRNVGGQFFLTEQVGFPSVINLANHYLLKKLPFGSPPVMLNKPVCRQDWEFHPEQVNCGKVLGQGAFGQVFHGKLRIKPNEEVEVAVKTMKVTMMTKEKIEEIMKEARLMRMLRHKNIIRCYGVSADSEPLMILIEFCSGGSLDTYLRANGVKITIDERVSMSYDAACGLNHIHRSRILHRDIAARNCLYGNKILKISDFGLSRLATQVKLDPTEKAPLKALAPEVFATQLYTAAADVWAFGVLLWEIFNNGAEPYNGWTGAQVKQEVMRKGNRLVIPEWTPPFMKDVMKKIFNPRSEQRLLMYDVLREIDAGRKKSTSKNKHKKGKAGGKMSQQVSMSREALVGLDKKNKRPNNKTTSKERGRTKTSKKRYASREKPSRETISKTQTNSKEGSFSKEGRTYKQ